MKSKELQQIRKQRVKHICQVTLTVVIIAFGIKFIIDNKILFSFIRTLTLGQFFICSGIMLINMVLAVIIDKVLLNALKIDIKWFDIVTVTFINSLLNCFLPFGGAYFVKGKYLKDKCGLSYSKFIALTVGTTIVNFFALISETMIVLWFIELDIGKKVMLECILAFSVIVLTIILKLFYKGNEMIIRIFPLKKQICSVIDGLYEIVSNKKVMIVAGLIYVFGTFLISIRFMLILQFMGERRAFSDSMFYQCAYQISSLVVLLPGNIGISEAIVGIANNFLGSEFGIGVTVTMINRLLYYIVCTMLGVASGGALFLRAVYEKMRIKQYL